MSEIKVSEALEKLLEDVAKIREVVQLQSFQYNLLLRRLNDLERLIQQKPIALGNAAVPPEPKVVMGKAYTVEHAPIENVASAAPAQQSSEKEKVTTTRVNVDGIINSLREGRKGAPKTPKEELKPKAEAKDDFDFKIEENAESKLDTGFKGQIPVTQLVYTPTGRPVCLAAVEIKDESGKVIQRIKTSSVGRWQTLLQPGKYVVHVIRKYDGKDGKDVIEYEQAFALQPTNKTVEIPAPDAFQRKSSEFKG